MSASGYVSIAVSSIKRATDLALLVVLEEGDEVWIPRSQVADEEDYEVGDADLTLSVSEWFANKEGLEAEE